MVSWFKKDPLLHGILILCGSILFAIVVIVSLFTYGLLRLFDPNYEEFGPTIALYKTKDCIEFEKPHFSSSEDCLVYVSNISMYKNNPPSLYEGIKRVVSGVSKRFEGLNFNPLDPLEWSCSVEGRVINDVQEKLSKKTYKCWPK